MRRAVFTRARAASNGVFMISLLVASFTAALAAFAAVTAGAQTYPSKTIRLIVPFPPGGLNDTAARLIQPHLEKALGQTVIVDNRPAASGIVGTDAVAKAAPDGHTLLMVASSYTVVPATNAKLPYDAERDFAPIAIVGKNPMLFVINAKVAAKTLAEFVALAKANPGKFNYATPGAASQSHLVNELLNQRAGITMQHIPYRGGAPAIQSTVAGEPRPIVERLNAEVNRAIRDPEMVAKLAALGVAPAGGTPEEFQKLIASEIRNWTAVARAATIKAE